MIWACSEPGSAALRATSGLLPIDEGALRQHTFLMHQDRCYCLAEYGAARGTGSGGSRVPLNRLIRDLKVRPRVVAISRSACRRKRHAILTCAAALRRCVTREFAERVTWVPIPPSRVVHDADHDDRLRQVLAAAFEGYDADVRRLVCQCRNAPADHAAIDRLSFAALCGLLTVDHGALAAAPIRSEIVLFDDVLTSGKHFKCCEQELRSFCVAPIVGIFLARRVLPQCRHGVRAPMWVGGD